METELAFDVRYINGEGWQVRIDNPLAWHTCRSEQEAFYIANGISMAHSVMRGALAGDDAADELEAARMVIRQNIGPCTAEKLLQSAANLARGGVQLDL